MQSLHAPSGAADQSAPGDTSPLISAHAAVVFVTAAIIGAIAEALTFFSTEDVAKALLAGLTGFGLSTVALHKFIGR